MEDLLHSCSRSCLIGALLCVGVQGHRGKGMGFKEPGGEWIKTCPLCSLFSRLLAEACMA